MQKKELKMNRFNCEVGLETEIIENIFLIACVIF